MSTRRNAVPLALLCASLAAGVGALAISAGPLRWALGASLALVLPGAALLALLGPRLAPADRVLAACACSIAVAIPAGLAIGVTHGGFDAAAWIVILAGVSSLLSAVALARPRGAAPARSGAPPRLQVPSGATTFACYAAAAAIVTVAIVLAHHSAERTSERAAQIANAAPQAPVPTPASLRRELAAERGKLSPAARRALTAQRGRSSSRSQAASRARARAAKGGRP